MNFNQGQFWRLLEITDKNPEYELYKSLITEFTDISGFDVLYYKKLPSEVLDDIYGEDPNAKYTNGYRTKIIYEPTEETNILDSFGITSDETIAYAQVPKTIFTRDVEEEYQENYDTTEEIIPLVGDCVRTNWNNKIYEIVEVGSEQKIFQGRKLIWEIILRPYRHSEESDSAEEMLFETPDEKDFPEDNLTTETEELSSYGDNEEIEDESNKIDNYNDIDESYYGY